MGIRYGAFKAVMGQRRERQRLGVPTSLQRAGEAGHQLWLNRNSPEQQLSGAVGWWEGGVSVSPHLLLRAPGRDELMLSALYTLYN